MKTTTITVNAECPGCGKTAPPKLGVPNSSQHGWTWDDGTEQRWCRRCHADLRARRHFEARGWVWKVTRHEPEGDHVRYVDEVTGPIDMNERWGRVTVTVVYDPNRVVLPPENIEELRDMMDDIVGSLEGAGSREELELFTGELTNAMLEEEVNL